jgi:tetratricopeptide (TPR) repeat protein
VLAAGRQRFPDDSDLLYEQAMMAEKLDRLDEMERLLRRVIELKPDNAHAHNALGYSLADRSQRLPEARELIQRALELSPGDPFITDSLGWVEYRWATCPKALRLLRQAYASRPDVEIGAHLGEVLWAMGQRDEARRIWREAKGRDAANDVLRETLARLRSTCEPRAGARWPRWRSRRLLAGLRHAHRPPTRPCPGPAAGSACASTPRPTSRRSSVSAAFELRGDSSRGELRLSRRWARRMAATRWSAAEAVLDTGQGETRYADLERCRARRWARPCRCAPARLAGRPALAGRASGAGRRLRAAGLAVDWRQAEGWIEAVREPAPA